MKCPNSWCPGSISEDYDCKVCGHVIRPDVRAIGCWFAVVVFIAAVMCCSGCGATITVNVLSSHSRYGQAIGGTNTTIKGQIEGGGALTATVPMSP